MLEDNIESIVITRHQKPGSYKPLGYSVMIHFKAPYSCHNVSLSAASRSEAYYKAEMYVRTGKFKQGNFFIRSNKRSLGNRKK